MKKKTKLLIALLLVFVGVGLTYAVYTTSVGGNASVESANWLIKVKVNETETDVSNGSNNVSLGSCQKLAPGGSCTLPFRVDATNTEVDTILTVELGNNVSGATLEELTNAGINLRIEDNGTEVYSYLLNMGSYKDLNLVINWEAGLEEDDVKAAADVIIANKLAEITIPVNMIVKQRTGGIRTVTFNTHDNNIQAPESIQVNDGETISNIPSLSKNGYIFVGWFTSENGGVQLTSLTPIVDNIEYHARFREKQNLTVTFNSDGGSSVAPVQVLEGDTLSELPSTPTKSGHAFLGWFDENNNELTLETVINNNITYTAYWEVSRDYSMAGTLIYYDPVTNDTCNSSTYTGSNTCYKWRIISTSTDKITLQLDHNLKNKGAWDVSGDNTNGPRTILDDLYGLTSSWTRPLNMTYNYDSSASTSNYGNLRCIDGICTITKSNTTIGTVANPMKVRIITGEEVVNIKNAITGSNVTFGNESISVTGSTSWLYENTGSSNKGYWTLSPRYVSNQAFLIHSSGALDYSSSYGISDSSDYGARPIIDISNSITVTYHLVYSNQTFTRQYSLYNSIGELPTLDEREGYTFLGWNTQSNGNGTYVNSNTIVDFSDLYAIWQSTQLEDFSYDSTSINNPAPIRYVAAKTGTYQLEVWGAQGGNAGSNYSGGKGGYATGNVELTQGDELYIVLGTQGQDSCNYISCDGGYNGGGKGAGNSSFPVYSGSGGGATHIGTFNDTLASHNSTNGLYIVAGGGGAASTQPNSASGNGGSGGGLSGINGSTAQSSAAGTGGSQITGGTAPNSSRGDNGSFGQGGDGKLYSAGGGAGYYGGGASNQGGGGGGSSYIGGVTNGSTIDGNSEMPSPTGGTEIGHSGNGYARITYIGN